MPNVPVCPFDGLRRLIVEPDIAHDLSAEIPYGSEDASCDDVPLKFREPDFNLVEPRGVGRREVQMNVFVVTKELLNPPRFMSGEVVSNDVNLFATRLLHDEVRKKGDELLARVTRRRGAKDLSSLRVECRIQREGSVPELLKPMSLGSPWQQRKYRIKAIQRLDGALWRYDTCSGRTWTSKPVP